MKLLTIAGWILWAGWVILLATQLFSRHVGGDGMGRAYATLAALILAPVMAIAGGLLFWGTRGGPAGAIVAGFTLVFLPVLVPVALTIKSHSHALFTHHRSRNGHFSNAKLRELALAVDARDTDAIQRLAADPSLDRSQRDPMGSTLLGYALLRAGDPTTGTAKQLEAVRCLLAAPGGKWDETALDLQGSTLARIAATGGERGTALMELALQHGADPNGLALSGNYSLIFDPVTDLARAKILARHGANFHALAPKSAGGIEGWTLLMCAVDRGRFDLASWLLEQGVNPRHVAPDGKSLETLLSESSLLHSEAPAPPDPDERRFIEALRLKLGPPR